MDYERSAGILLHPTSLSGRYGIGDIGASAYRWIDFLVESKLRLWQILPLGPTGYGDSPYASSSSFAGNPMLISLDHLVTTGDLEQSDVEAAHDLPTDHVDFGGAIAFKYPLLMKAAKTFLKRTVFDSRFNAYGDFCKKHASWLDDYALFIAIKEHFDAKAAREQAPESIWNRYWDQDIARRTPEAIVRWKTECATEINVQKVLQFFFFEQWLALKSYANEKQISIIGDLPIYVSEDSADVWASPESFRMDEDCCPVLVAGVPPDYFSETGQLWGNPVYNWQAMEANAFQWWIRRFKGTRELVDILRVDHFRGFEAGWSIPAGEKTAVNGEWIKAPGMALFAEVHKQLGNLPILAEDLGLITPEVEFLRDNNHFPGMRILQFAFENAHDRSSIFLPHNHIKNSVVYTGTHDNDTILGWYQGRSDLEKARIQDYFGHQLTDVAWDFIRVAFASTAQLAIIPMQDALRLPSECRMNTPATCTGNWRWRMEASALTTELSAQLAQLTHIYDR